MRLALAAAAVTFIAAAAAHRAPAQAPVAEPGQAQFETGCSGCHDLAMATSRSYSAAKWDEVVQDMIGKGAPIEDADRAAIVGYLAKHHGDGS